MLSFHNDPLVKQKYLSRVQAHATADALIQGTGWDGSKGCAVGCTLEAYDHSRYPIELGLPEWLARLEDSIFEGLPVDHAMTWPQRFLESIPVGVHVEVVHHRLSMLRIDRLITLQTESLGKHGIDEVLTQVITALQVVRRCHEAESNGVSCDVTFEQAAAESARSARSAAESAESARSAWSAARSAWSAAESARSAAESARSAAESARSAESAWSAESAAESARSAESAWIQESEDLLKLLSELI